ERKGPLSAMAPEGTQRARRRRIPKDPEARARTVTLRRADGKNESWCRVAGRMECSCGAVAGWRSLKRRARLAAMLVRPFRKEGVVADEWIALVQCPPEPAGVWKFRCDQVVRGGPRHDVVWRPRLAEQAEQCHDALPQAQD